MNIRAPTSRGRYAARGIGREDRRGIHMTITGGCLCGAVRYSIEAEPKFIRHCWCRDCQYIGAGAGTVNVFFATEAVKVEGALAVLRAPPRAATSCTGAIALHAGRRCLRRPRRGCISSACAPAPLTIPSSPSRKWRSGPRAHQAGPPSKRTSRTSRSKRHRLSRRAKQGADRHQGQARRSVR